MMRKEIVVALAIAVFSTMVSAAVRAEEAVKVTLEVKKVVIDAEGKELLKSADAVQPGDLLEYTAIYRNVSKKGIRGLEATLPIPNYTEYQPNSVSPSGARASLDKANFAAMPLKRIVKRENGVDVEQVIPYSEYRSLRWYPGELAAGEVRHFSTRVRVANHSINLASDTLNVTVGGSQ
jgi:uncharacterized repeat protein (TIGR01451 family)